MDTGIIAIGSATAFHVFLVNRRATATDSNTVRTGLWTLGSVGPTQFPKETPDGTIYDDCFSNSLKSCGTPVVALNTPNVYEVLSKGSYWGNRINGIVQHTTATNTIDSTAGVFGSSSGSKWYPGDWAELVVYNRELNSAERSLVINYFNGRYGLGAI